MSGREACQILANHGFVFVRQKGSHRIMQRTLADTTITAVVPDHAELRTGTLMSIIRQSQLRRDLFE